MRTLRKGDTGEDVKTLQRLLGVAVDGVDGYSSGNYFYGEGKPLYTYRLYKFAGVNPETGQSRWYTRNTDADGKEYHQKIVRK